MRVTLREKQQHDTVELQRVGAGYRVSIGDRTYAVEPQYLDETTLLLTIDGLRYRVHVARNGRERHLGIEGEVYTFAHEPAAPSGHAVATVTSPEITAPMPGKVLQVLVRPGDRVAAGDPLLILEAMKMETRLVAETNGTVSEVRVGAGAMVDGGQLLLVLEYDAA